MSAGASTSPVFDFTSLDFDSIRTDLTRYAQQAFPAEMWTDFNDSNMGTFLLELMAYATDLVAYNMNSQVLETLVMTLVREQNFINRAKSLDYTLKGPQAATTTIRFANLSSDLGDYPLTISSHLQLTSPDGQVFQPSADTTLAAPPPGLLLDVAASQGIEAYQEGLGTSNGQPGQVYTLSNPSALLDTLLVQVGAYTYTRVDNAVAAGVADRVYLVATDEFGVSTITFGDGINGIIPTFGSAITATYKYGGGTAGNLPAGVAMFPTGMADGTSVPAQLTGAGVTASIYVAAEGGAPKQTLENAKATLPTTLKANDRAVELGDYAALAVELVSGVFKASAVSGVPVGGAAPVLLFVVPNGGGNPSAALANSVLVALKPKKMAGKRIRVKSPAYVSMSIVVDVFVLPASGKLATAQRVRELLLAKYDMAAVDFGVALTLQDLYESLDGSKVDGVSRVFLRTFSVTPHAGVYINRPTTGDGGVSYVTNLQPALVQRREWAVVVIPPDAVNGVYCNRFKVYERRLGVVSSLSDDLIVDEGANFESSLAGQELLPNPEAASVSVSPLGAVSFSPSFSILGNTSSTVTTSSGLLVWTEPGDEFVVQKVNGIPGKILTTTVSAPAPAGQQYLEVADSTSFGAGDAIYVVGATPFWAILAGVDLDGANTLRMTAVLSTNVAGGATVACGWQDAEAKIAFCVIDGANPFVVGDMMYVDTYAQAGDITLRPENFPLLTAADFTINTIGGV